MPSMIAMMTLLVRDYDEAITYYTKILGFDLVEDTVLSPSKRWVVVTPDAAEENGVRILLARAANDEQRFVVGNQAGGRVFLFLYTADFNDTYESYKARGVRFLEEPRIERYGKVAIFKDLYGNKWDLIEPNLVAAF
ncbi:MAG: VOC family protein [Marinicaulis sp.]|nr:VOC family protein [Marinicaulis sp.]